MRRQFTAVIAALIFLLGSNINGSAQHELEYKSKKANKNDVIGTWEMTYQIVRPTMKTDSLFFADLQILQFSEDGFVKNVASTEKLDSEALKIYLTTMPKKATFSFVADGLLIIERSQQDFSNIVISIITEDLNEPLRDNAPLLKKGNLILSYLDPNKQSYMQRYFKKIILKE